MESGIGPEDVSSIYPLETNECYFNYDNRQLNEQKRNESTGNLNDILDHLNKSGNDVQDQMDMQRNTSTASETGGSATEDPKFNKAKSSVDTPKTKLGQWGKHKDNSSSELLEEFKT